MSNKHRGLLIIFIFAVSTMLISACTQSLSSAPASTPTVIPTGLFVSTLPAAENPMKLIEEFAKQTAAAQTTVANGGTPVTPQAIAVTPQPGNVTAIPSTPTNSVPSTPIVASGPITTPIPDGVRPASYTLQEGEFPYCIARRFNVDPVQLCSLNGISCNDNYYYAGSVLKIPQSGAFPGDRSLAAHPTNYTVLSSAETLYSIACKYGNVDPASLASVNGISASAKLTSGQQIKIP